VTSRGIAVTASLQPRKHIRVTEIPLLLSAAAARLAESDEEIGVGNRVGHDPWGDPAFRGDVEREVKVLQAPFDLVVGDFWA
jgi:hypothetical protein